jgi:endoglucanase
MTRRQALAGLAAFGIGVALYPGFAPVYGQALPSACGFLAKSSVPASRISALTRGFNLPGWLDGQETRRPDMQTLGTLHQRGFTHVRLPVTPERLLPAFSTSSDIARDRAELNSAIKQLISIGFAVSLDLHPGARLGRLHVAEPERAFALIDILWRDLAREYANYRPDRLFFEVLNEPGVRPEIWDTQGPRIAATIRSNAPNHTIIYGTADFQQIHALPPVPMTLTNVVYAVHYYAPMVFTHQGQEWNDDPLRDLRGVPFPASRSDAAVASLLKDLRYLGRTAAAELLETALREPWDEKRVAAEVSRVGEWSKRHNQPVVLNEFGVLAWRAPVPDRLRWLETVRRSAEQACVGWAHWDYADAFGFVRRIGDKEIADQAVLRALLGE